MLRQTLLALMVRIFIIALFVSLRMPNGPVFGLSPMQIFIVVVVIAGHRALAGALAGNSKQH
jgi:hypothetical protein